MHKFMLVCASVLFIAACQSQPQYSYPGYYQPAQYQVAYTTEGSFDALGNYHPPVVKGGQYLPGRWYRAQPGNPGPVPQQVPQRVHAIQNPTSTTMGEVNYVSVDGDVATGPTCYLPEGC